MKARAGPSGIHFFDRKTGLNVLIDEIHVSQALWAAAPRFVSVALTNACDLSCPYCFVTKDAAELEFGHRARAICSSENVFFRMSSSSL